VSKKEKQLKKKSDLQMLRMKEFESQRRKKEHRMIKGKLSKNVLMTKR
jgi:hypothetical protein